MGFNSEKPYLIEAKIEFIAKYEVETPAEAIAGHPERLREWCALVQAKKKVREGESWLTGHETPRERKRIVESYHHGHRPADGSLRGEESDCERDP